jgi:gliding-associated putative ABC transporter substrate-binding component GldG
VYQIPEDIDMLIIAKPSQRFSEKSLFKIDQYIMNGGKVIFMIDPLVVNLDSIRKNGQYVPYQADLGFDDLFFKYGIKVEPTLVLDLECSTIPLAVDQPGGRPTYQQFKWFYHLIAAGVPDHPITKGLDRVNLLFPASLDTVRTKTEILKTPLLKSSPYSRKQFSPVLLDFNVIRTAEPNQFTGPPEVLAMLLEGVFPSVYENRASSAMLETLEQIGSSFKSQSEPTKLLVISDGDIGKNLYNPGTGEISELGFNRYMNYTFANKNFLTNAIEYMLDNRGLMEARSKSIKLRLLDRQKISRERLQWQMINLALPLILLFGVGWFFQYLRRRKYGN